MFNSRILAFALPLAFALASAVQAQSDGAQRTELQTRDGTVEVRWGRTDVPTPGPKPPFAELDRDHNGRIDESEALGWAGLANDFILADRDRNGSISPREYQHW